MDFAAVLFDVDGVLLDSTAAHHRIWTTWAELRHLNPDTVWQQTFGRRPEDTVQDVAPYLDPIAERRVLDELMRLEGDAFPPVTGAAALLDSLPLDVWAIVTSGSRKPVHQRFRHAGLRLPKVQIYGEDVLKAKPHPDGYLLAAAHLGAEPARCLVVEDAPAGIEAGKAAGCTVIGITSTHRAEELLQADACIASLAELTPYLTRLQTRGGEGLQG
ncbi:HAD-IA family hydrolase [Streptomyces mirabilis]|uniref:HAD-IA family hydrolase n=1 Tax=Streptomyces mirabilis TaxID=68239 RepID=UPI00371D30FE